MILLSLLVLLVLLVVLLILLVVFSLLIISKERRAGDEGNIQEGSGSVRFVSVPRFGSDKYLSLFDAVRPRIRRGSVRFGSVCFRVRFRPVPELNGSVRSGFLFLPAHTAKPRASNLRRLRGVCFVGRLSCCYSRFIKGGCSGKRV